jgi:DNA/RNA endonuclease G (NUC1)
MFLQHYQHKNVVWDGENDKAIGRNTSTTIGMQNIKIPLPFWKMWVRRRGAENDVK